tara:strand:- start:2248 stop:3684 length:1437 start_codon:yes stop_codon:yes gene_type:complete
MPFTTYKEVSNYGAFITHVTSTGYMPPWTPDPEYTSFIGERFLTQSQIDLLATWYEAGMPEGNPKKNPGVPEFPKGSQIGEPDLVIKMPEPYAHGGDMTDQYQVFVLETGVTEEKFIKAVEIRPGNAEIAHHCILAYTEKESSIIAAEALDRADPDVGYESFGDHGVPVDDFNFGEWTPGATIKPYPPFIGKRISPDGRFLMQMHYGPNSIEHEDLTKVNLFFADKPVQRRVKLSMMLTGSLSEPFFIPANQVKTFHGRTSFAKDISVLAITPHCHLLGQSWLCYAVSADLSDTIPLVSIPEYDFNWQGPYTFQKMKHIPAGYTIHAICKYDNTKDNPLNPNDPPEMMTWGELYNDEMFLYFMQYVDYLPGDENLDSNDLSQDEYVDFDEDYLFPVWPDSAASNENVKIAFYLNEQARVSFEFMNVRGDVLTSHNLKNELSEGIHWDDVDLTCPQGTYFLRMKTSTGSDERIRIEVTD